MPGSVTGSTRMDEIEQKYDVVMNFPNLELHSAAAEGNVGLVHYALTHGQPVNSVLHGVQPIHAAAAGGSVSALKMLIDRGADVNAPRLPRRYSNEKKRGVPSLGAAGATPLHFAAANGHAPIVQLLLTCGALPDKSDKLGQTPETLAEANGHEDVLHVLKVYDHLKRQDSGVETISSASGSMAYSGHGSPGPSVIQLEEDARPSRKGKERAMSIASNRSDASGILKLRKSLDGLLGRRSRRNSVSTEIEDIPPVPPLPASPPRIDIQEPDIPDPDNDTLRQAGTASRPSSPDGLPFPPSRDSSVYHSMHSSPVSVHTELPTDNDPPLPELARIPSSESQASASTFASLRSGPHPTLPREHRKSHSSRRPSLPSILEKAAHPGQAFRNALHHRREQDQVRFSSDADSPRSVSGNSFFGRGRRTTAENLSSGSSGGSQTLSGAQDKARKYMSRHAFIGLFRRSNSPPSRSPSPPRRTDRSPIDAQELEEGMERFKRASIELDRKERRSLDESREREVIPRSTPNSAPPIKTRFFEDLGPTPLNIPNSFFISPRAEGRKSPISPPSADRPWNRPRKGSGVIAPSPLANEWARESSDSDSTAPAGIRRTRTEGGREHGPSRLSESNGPGSLRANKQRSATLPSSPAISMSGLGRNATVPRLADLALDDRMDLRSGVLRRESEKKREEIGAEEEEDEEVFHDAQADVEEVIADGESTPVMDLSEELPERIEKEASTSPVTSSIQNRYRGASIGSMNSQSSRLSALSRLNPSDDSNSDKYRYRGFDKLPHPNPPSVSGDTRPRGKSVSSIATTASGSGLGFSSYNHSTSATSLTPPSTLSITLGSAFPPVPEDDVANHPSSAIPPVPQRKFSTRAEAAKVIKQQEDDMLQLAQLPLNANSTRDLAAQLAAYGENHVIEQELAQIERRERKYARRTGRSKFEIQDDTGSSKSSSFVSAPSVHSGVESGVSGATSSRRSESVGSSRLRPDTAPSLVSVEAPKSSVPNISSIYDRRATLYREKMQALTSAPALHPPPRSKSGPRQRAVTENLPTGPPAWLTGSQSPAHHRNGREISASLPVGSLPVQPPGQGIMAGASTPKPPRNRKESFNSVRPPSSMSAPPPIADIVNTRYQGLAGPSSLRPSTTLYAPSSRAASRTAQSINGSITPAPAPPLSIFSHRYAGPHDGGESDDSEGENKGYTMVENNWRGKMVQADGNEALKKGKWGFKGPFGKKK